MGGNRCEIEVDYVRAETWWTAGAGRTRRGEARGPVRLRLVSSRRVAQSTVRRRGPETRPREQSEPGRRR